MSAMSAGIDIGTATSCVALTRGSAATILTNADGLRETPSAVFYGKTSRAVGFKASTMFTSNPKRTIVQVKRLMGKSYKGLQHRHALLYDVKEHSSNDACLISVAQQAAPELLLRPEQVMASLLKDLSSTAERHTGKQAHCYALSIPCFYGQAERSAMLAAAEVAGLPNVTLVHELTAAALSWASTKTDLPEDTCKPKHVAFVDVGHSATQVCIATLTKSQILVKAHCWDQNAGGSDMDRLLSEHLASEFLQQTGEDIAHNVKARAKLGLKVSRCRELLTASSKSYINIDNLTADSDFRSQVSVELFNVLCSSLIQQIGRVCQRALRAAGLRPDEVHVVERLGGASRTPAIVQVIREVFALDKDPKTTMNHKECVARGSALLAAMRSSAWKGDILLVKDVYPFPTICEFPVHQEPHCMNILLALEAEYSILFFRSHEFSLRVFSDTSDHQYQAQNFLRCNRPVKGSAPQSMQHIASVDVRPPALRYEQRIDRIGVTFSRDQNGMFNLKDIAVKCQCLTPRPVLDMCQCSLTRPCLIRGEPTLHQSSHLDRSGFTTSRTTVQKVIEEEHMQYQDLIQLEKERARNMLEEHMLTIQQRVRMDWDTALVANKSLQVKAKKCLRDIEQLLMDDGFLSNEVSQAEPDQLQAVADGICRYAGWYLNWPTATAGAAETVVEISTQTSNRSLQEELQPAQRQAQPATPAGGPNVADHQAAPSSLRQKRDTMAKLLLSLDNTLLDRASNAWYGRAIACTLDMCHCVYNFMKSMSKNSHTHRHASESTEQGERV